MISPMHATQKRGPAPVLFQVAELAFADHPGQYAKNYRHRAQKQPVPCVAAGKFAFLGPFETNQQGRRELYLWVALPLEDPAADVTPVFLVNGKPLVLGTPGRSADSAGLRQSPYKIPTSWIAMFYYRVEHDVIAQLAEAGSIRIQTVENTKAGPARTNYSIDIGQDPRLREFAAR